VTKFKFASSRNKEAGCDYVKETGNRLAQLKKPNKTWVIFEEPGGSL
jgi:hypothetical protein